MTWPKIPQLTPIVKSTTKNSSQKLPNFFNRNYKHFRIFRRFENLSNLIGGRVMTQQNLPKCWQPRDLKGWKLAA